MVTRFDFLFSLIRFWGPSWGLLISHGRVQRWREQSGVRVGDLEVLYVWARQCLTLASLCELLGKEWKCKCRGRLQDRRSHLEHIHPSPHLFSMHLSHAPGHNICLMWQMRFSHLMGVRQSCNQGYLRAGQALLVIWLKSAWAARNTCWEEFAFSLQGSMRTAQLKYVAS